MGHNAVFRLLQVVSSLPAEYALLARLMPGAGDSAQISHSGMLPAFTHGRADL